ncbi:hypothetical protein ABW20_dc0102788 [Dactylellina cionopaga]|nr:hypothetical protein ABW20_dc0102788 [Dactylellina cionopaga]
MATSVPFPKDSQFYNSLDTTTSAGSSSSQGGPAFLADARLPGHPALFLSETSSLEEFLHAELETETLDLLADTLYPLSKRDGELIDPLHRQVLKGRKIVITEDPGLHLIWFYDKIYIKPLPEYLGSYSFWEHFLCDSNTTKTAPPANGTNNGGSQPNDDALKRAALGFVRTYARLIVHHSDFRIAQENNLIPTWSTNSTITWDNFSRFLSHFRNIPDEAVTQRYSYGQLRLTRLNWAMRMIPPKGQRRFYYYRVHWQTGDYVKQHFNSLLFVFAAIALVLGAMQVCLAAKDFTDPEGSWNNFARASWGFGVFTIVFFLAIIVAFLLGVCISLTSQLSFGVRWERNRRKKLTIEKR